jgi:hypothetical protein
VPSSTPRAALRPAPSRLSQCRPSRRADRAGARAHARSGRGRAAALLFHDGRLVPGAAKGDNERLSAC